MGRLRRRGSGVVGERVEGGVWGVRGPGLGSCNCNCNCKIAPKPCARGHSRQEPVTARLLQSLAHEGTRILEDCCESLLVISHAGQVVSKIQFGVPMVIVPLEPWLEACVGLLALRSGCRGCAVVAGRPRRGWVDVAGRFRRGRHRSGCRGCAVVAGRPRCGRPQSGRRGCRGCALEATPGTPGQYVRTPDATALSKAPHVPGLARPLCLYVRTPEWRDGPKATTEMNGADADDDDGKCTYVRTYG